MATAANAADFVERLYAVMALFRPVKGLNLNGKWEPDLTFLEVRTI